MVVDHGLAIGGDPQLVVPSFPSLKQHWQSVLSAARVGCIAAVHMYRILADASRPDASAGERTRAYDQVMSEKSHMRVLAGFLVKLIGLESLVQ